MKSVKLLVHLLVDVSLVQKVREILQVSLYKTYIYDNICVMKIKYTMYVIVEHVLPPKNAMSPMGFNPGT